MGLGKTVLQFPDNQVPGDVRFGEGDVCFCSQLYSGGNEGAGLLQSVIIVTSSQPVQSA